MNKGSTAEEYACLHLKEQGMEIVARNWWCRSGEVDIVALDGPTLVFVEVRSRTGTRYGAPEESLSRSKLRRLWRAAHLYLGTIDPPFPVRFDVVAVSPDGIRHFRNAFSEQDVRQDR
ncbi:MAG: YraN family protein [Candidatus Bipolaricaulota bacterium]